MERSNGRSGENYIMRSIIIRSSHYSDDKMKKNDVRRGCSRYGRRGLYRVLLGRPEGKNHFEDQAMDGSIILKWIFKKWYGGIDWIDLALYMDRWRALVNAVMNIRVPYNAGTLSS